MTIILGYVHFANKIIIVRQREYFIRLPEDMSKDLYVVIILSHN